MRSIKSIATNMVGEALNRLIFQVILIFGVVFMVAGFFFTYLDPGEEGKMLKDLGLTTLTIFGMLMAIFMAVSTITPEVERRTIYCLIAKPVKRHYFFLGKFLGSVVILGIACLVMGLVLVLALYVKEQVWSLELLSAVGLTFVSLSIMSALVMTLSTVASPMLAVVGGFVFWALGYAQGFMHQLAAHADNPTSRGILESLGSLAPNLQVFDIRAAMVDQVYIPPSYYSWLGIYAVMYLVVVLVIGIIAFNQKQL